MDFKWKIEMIAILEGEGGQRPVANVMIFFHFGGTPPIVSMSNEALEFNLFNEWKKENSKKSRKNKVFCSGITS